MASAVCRSCSCASVASPAAQAAPACCSACCAWVRSCSSWARRSSSLCAWASSGAACWRVFSAVCNCATAAVLALSSSLRRCCRACCWAPWASMLAASSASCGPMSPWRRKRWRSGVSCSSRARVWRSPARPSCSARALSSWVWAASCSACRRASSASHWRCCCRVCSCCCSLLSWARAAACCCSSVWRSPSPSGRMPPASRSSCSRASRARLAAAKAALPMRLYTPVSVSFSSRAPRSLSSALRKALNSLCASSTARVNCCRLRPRRSSICSRNSLLLLVSSWSLSRSRRLCWLFCSLPLALSRARRTSQRAR
ncbi:hypothetical protein D3C85_984560 [compost metagenome]